MKVHPVFYIDRLRRARNDPLPGQRQPEPEPIVVQDEPEWKVESVKSSKVDRGVLKYQAQWAGFDRDDDFYDAAGFKNAAARLVEYHDRYPDAPGPPVNLAYWMECAARDEDPEAREDDNVPVKEGTRRTRRRNRL